MQDKINKLFTTNGLDVWRLIAFCAHPSVEFENVETKKRTGGAMEVRILTHFTS